MRPVTPPLACGFMGDMRAVERVIQTVLDPSRSVADGLHAVRALCNIDQVVAYRVDDHPLGSNVALFVSRGQRRRRRDVSVARDLADPRWFDLSDPRLRVDTPCNDTVGVQLCEGPHLFAWMDGFTHGKFESRDRQRLDRLVPALRARFALEARVDRERAALAAFDAMLERERGPSMLLDDAGRLLHGNAAARRLTATQVRARLRDAGAGRSADDDLLALNVDSSRAYLMLPKANGGGLEASVALKAAEWGLSAREFEAAKLLARGMSGKEASDTLGCSLRTFEVHCRSIFRKAGVEGRARFAAKLWE